MCVETLGKRKSNQLSSYIITECNGQFGFNHFLYTILVSMAHDREYLSIRGKLKYAHRRRNHIYRRWLYIRIKYYYKILMQFYVESIKYKVIISDFFCDCSVYWCPLRLDIHFAQLWKIFLDNPVQCCSSFPLIVSSLFLKVRSSEIYKSFAIFKHMQKYICTVYIKPVNVFRLHCNPILIELVSSTMSGWRNENLLNIVPTKKSYFVACQVIPFAFSNIPVNTGTSTVKPLRTGGHRKADSDSMLWTTNFSTPYFPPNDYLKSIYESVMGTFAFLQQKTLKTAGYMDSINILDNFILESLHPFFFNC